ncbi:branched-chain amino acid ABC transporter permease [Parasphaerochaeta coccoides]|uniref:Amino acid/amide ABC transporter membrane protein 2, HAAT family n=1 Tax=Parasphaerochaeta coccoides (strain ATCC BAA-1237 / DSM 17374 / SPN1) TaxID=760011 RepID=F4GHZ2_PARC1|nr:branched-chain amino acid ABC transporter permease [Parasphaerochaeta coccoides]AEC02105.1 amino acid/amide ABC transporter membrane protein 2, HAAT family [Parasphaerochaeta coccoides DSM 17374]
MKKIMKQHMSFFFSRKKILPTVGAIAVFLVFLAIAPSILGAFELRIFNLCGIYVVLALSMNLINGFTGQFSLGHAGFMAVGAYVSALLTMSPATKSAVYYLKPIVPFLATVQVPFTVALVMAGLVTALVAALIGAPVLRLKDDYLAIATLGFSEIIRVVFTNLQSITNGSLGLKNIPRYTTIWWAWGTALFVIAFMVLLIKGSYGRAFKAIRDDEIAAEAMGVNLFSHKLAAFMIGAFFAGVGGALMGNQLGAIDPNMYKISLTYNILLIVVLGGIGSITGSVISAMAVTILMELLRPLDESMNVFGLFIIPGIPGMRMVVFSAILMSIILFYQRGIMGNKEFSWEAVARTYTAIRNKMRTLGRRKAQ